MNAKQIFGKGRYYWIASAELEARGKKVNVPDAFPIHRGEITDAYLL